MNSLTIFALVLFAVTYILMFTLQQYRPFIALLSAIVFVVVGSVGLFEGFSYSFRDALGEIDWNVVLMIAGTMGTVYLFILSKMPNRLADMIMVKAGTVQWMVVFLSLFAGIISAFVDNVATVLMIAPVALAISRKLKISPVPVIICISLSSNLQGAATLVGDTTSILLGKAAGLDFMDFFFVEGHPGIFWVTEAGALMAALLVLWSFRKSRDRIEVGELTEVEDRVPTCLLLGTVVTLIAVSFIPYKSNAEAGQFYKPEITNGLICVGFFLFGVIRQAFRDRNLETAKDAFREIDYNTIALLMGLFVIIGGISRAGIIEMIGQLIAGLSGDGTYGSIFLVYSIIVWMSVLLSAFIDNIPYTATMLPVVAVVASKLSASGSIVVHPNLLYFGLLVGATLGGNITPIGASANITGMGILQKEGYTVKAGTFMKFGIPFTLTAVTTGWLLLWVIWM